MSDNSNKRIKKPLGLARLIEGKCITCGICAQKCAVQAITSNEKGDIAIDVTKCNGCRRCIKVCPAAAIEIYFTPEQQEILNKLKAEEAAAAPEPAEADLSGEAASIEAQIKAYRNVWVFVEHDGDNAASVSWELLGVGSGLAKTLGVELCAVVIGQNVNNLCQEAMAYGAVKVYCIDSSILSHYRTESYNRAVKYLVTKYKPEVLLVGATAQGRDLAGAVATGLATGLTADCTGLDIDENRHLLQTRPAFGGNIMATILTEKARPQMATVRPHVMPMPEKNPQLKGTIINESLPFEEKDIPAKLLEIIYGDKRDQGQDIAAATVIVSGGRGMLAKENFSILQELADELGGVVAGSRMAVEAGWIPQERQVGQTGKTVRPKIYIACGISGAIQHLVGMQDSDLIIAINRDRQAPIFEVASYGIEGDLFQIVPAITKRIRELKAAKV